MSLGKQEKTALLDIFNHVLPRDIFDRLKTLAPHLPALTAFEKLTPLYDLDARFRIMDEFPGYQQIICLSNPPLEYVAPADETPELARRVNDRLADLVRLHPDRFPAFIASLPMNNPEASVAEAERAITQLGAVGVQVFTNVLGRPLSHSDYAALFETMVRLDRPVWIHPMRGPDRPDYASETGSQDEIWFTFGWPYETSACVTRLIFSGLFDRLPTLRIVTHHMGGMIPFFADKIALGFSQIFDGTPDHNPAAERAGLRREPIDYYRMLLADTAVNGSAAATACGHSFFGTSHCLFATDAPFDPVGGRNMIGRTIAAVKSLQLPPQETEAIFSGNARKLLRLGS